MSTITDIINYLQEYVCETDIKLYLGANQKLIYDTETANNIQLPDDVKLFYEFTDGFFSEEDQFRIAPLYELVWKEKDVQHIYIAEYMVYCDMWELIVNPENHNDYQIIKKDQHGNTVKLTNSFAEFLQRFLNGGVFEKAGLYDWHDEIISSKFLSGAQPVIAKFVIEHIYRIMIDKPVLFGQIIDGEIAVGNVIYLDFEIYKGLFYIESIEGVRSSNLDTIGLIISYYDANLDDKIKTLIGHTIDVYNFPPLLL